MTDDTRDDEIDDIVSAVLTASRVLVAVSARSLAGIENTVTVTQFRALVVLAGRGTVNLNGLADALGVTPSTALRMVDRLVAAGVVTRTENPDDRREVLLSVTTKGRRLVRTVTDRRRAEIARTVRAMPPTHRAGLVRALRAFAEAADEPDPEVAAALGW